MQRNGSTYDVEQHQEHASYKPNLSITMAWDRLDNDNFTAPFVKNNPDSNAEGKWVDIFYNDALVFRQLYVSVDGGRMNLPIPTLNNGQWEVSQEHADFMYIINGVVGVSRPDYDSVLARNGIQVTSTPWSY